MGEAPGEQEARTGRPFIGPAGNVLDELLQIAGISRSECYITNVVKVRPENNNISLFINMNRKVPVETQEYQEYVRYLKEELEKLPNLTVVVPLGNVSMYALTGERKITKRRGSILESSLLPGKKIIPTIHPAATIYEKGKKGGGNHLLRFEIISDLEKVKKESKTSKITRPNRRYILRPSHTEAMAVLDMMHNSGSEVAFDIEIVNHEVSCISFAINKGTIAISIPLAEGRANFYHPDDELELWNRMAQLLEDREVMKVAQNAVFDCSYLYHLYGIFPEPVRDTMIAEGILLPDFPKGLDFITSIYTDEPYYKDEGKETSFKKLDDNFWLYNAKDSAICSEVLEKQCTDLMRLGDYHTYRMQNALIPPLVYMMMKGIRIDVPVIAKVRAETEEKIAELHRRLADLAGSELNPNSPKQLQEYFYIKKGFKPYVDRSTGNITTDEIALKRLTIKGSKEAEIILDIRSLTTLLTRYLTVALTDDNRLTGSYNPVGTTSGRLSSSKALFVNEQKEEIGANMQNLHPVMKEAMLADDGYIQYNADASQAENRIVAYIGPVPEMIAAFEAEVDVHKLTAALIAGVKMSELSPRPEDCPIAGGKFNWRFWGKKANHAFNYGLGYSSFALQFEISVLEGKRIYTAYHAAYPGVRKMHKWVQEELRMNGRTLSNLFGRKRKFYDKWGDNLFRSAYDFIPQSTVGELLNKWAVLPLYYYPFFEGVELQQQVHDSVRFQIPVSDGFEYHAAVLLRLKQSMEQKLEWRGRKFYIPADISMSLRVSENLNLDLNTYNTIESLAEQIEIFYKELKLKEKVWQEKK